MADLFDADTRLVGSLEAIRFESDDGSFMVASVTGPRGQTTVIGNLCGASVGERLQLVGRWETNAKFGRQFRATDVVILPPASREGIIRYLSSGMIEGMGPVLAERLVDRFGERTLDVIEGQRHRLLEVPGIGKVRQRRILKAWDKQRAVRRVMVFLASNGVSTTYAHRIYQFYGNSAVEVVRKYPYQLARDIFGIGFKSADRIALKGGIREDDPERLAAGLQWTLEQAGKDGHVYLPRDRLIEVSAEILGVGESDLDRCLDQLCAEGGVVSDDAIRDGEPAIYTRGAHSAEAELAALVAAMAGEVRDEATSRSLAARAERAETQLGIRLDAGQKRAIRTLVGRRLGILTGGPGTGKTTILKIFADAVAGLGGRVLLAAPTGRAARRLGEATGRKATTLHRMLQYSFAERRFLRDGSNPLEADFIIVDEVSMLDQYLARALFRAVPRKAALLLVGDSDQLPSVGAGNVLHDVLAFDRIAKERLTEVFRQEGGSDIVEAAHRIRVGETPESTAKPSGRGDFFHIAVDTPETALERILEVVCNRAPKAFGLDPVEDVQVLSPMHRGEVGIQALNRELQARLNPNGRPISSGDHELRIGDKVMQLRNNYQLEVFNGQIGRVTGVDLETGDVKVRFDAQMVRYGRNNLFELALAYCISIHKSQGSEYAAVVMALTTQHFPLLQRNLLYTGVTRAKRLVCLVGQTKAMHIALKNAKTARRYTGLTARLLKK
jgi:exodeoxyribonuclease V alpha subunit